MGSILQRANELIEQYGSVESYLKAMEIEGKLRPMVTIPEIKKEEIPYFPDPEEIIQTDTAKELLLNKIAKARGAWDFLEMDAEIQAMNSKIAESPNFCMKCTRPYDEQDLPYLVCRNCHF